MQQGRERLGDRPCDARNGIVRSRDDAPRFCLEATHVRGRAFRHISDAFRIGVRGVERGGLIPFLRLLCVSCGMGWGEGAGATLF